jgi:rSAM/selenodomain-associated transferase 1
MEEQALIIFAKNPILGKVKTRLAADVGEIRSLEIYEQLLFITENVINHLNVDRLVYWDGGIPRNSAFSKSYFIQRKQIEGGLGKKMSSAFDIEFQTYKSICIIGTDCPELNSEILCTAFQELKVHDVVIGPATDGGYYLLGMNGYYQNLFQDMIWSTETVFQETIKRINNSKLTFKTLPMLSDVDTNSDYLEMKRRGLIL